MSTRQPLPEWVRDKLVESGVMTNSGVTRAARIRHCRSCGLCVLAGLDADICALEVHADPTPLTPMGEAIALIAGRRTYALGHTRGRLELDRRDSWHIAGRPAGTGRTDVLTEHRCDEPMHAFAAPSNFDRPRSHTLPPNSPCPF